MPFPGVLLPTDTDAVGAIKQGDRNEGQNLESSYYSGRGIRYLLVILFEHLRVIAAGWGYFYDQDKKFR